MKSFKAICLILPAFILASCNLNQTSLSKEDDTNPHFRKASKYEADSNFPAAIREYEAALRDNPNVFSAESHMGLLYDKLGNPIAAIYHFQNYIQARPDAKDIDEIQGRLEKAKSDFAVTLPNSPARNAEEFARIGSENLQLKRTVADLQMQLAKYKSSDISGAPTIESSNNTQNAGSIGAPSTNALTATNTLIVTSTNPPAVATNTVGSTGNAGTLASTNNTTIQKAVPVDPNAPARSHTIAKGDSLWKIARQYYPEDIKAGVEKIKAANPDKAAKERGLKLGDTLIIP